MITFRHSFNKLMSISLMVLACIFSGKDYAFAQADTTSITSSDSLEVMPLQRFDFGIPNPNADKTKIEPVIDFLKAATSEEIQQASLEATLLTGNDDYSVMALSDDNTEYAVGQIPYQEDVTPYGGRIYNIPIMVSPMSDFPPQISLQYNSQAGNGLAGFGWSIGGLSSITLTNKNHYYHGTVAPATLSGTNGAYLLDGVPLVQNDDSSLSSEYQLETAKGHILVKKHMSASAVCYFTVLYPDGSKATYGMTSNTSAKTVYPITLWEDRLGNQIVYNYSYTNSDYRVTSIQFKHKNNSSYIGRINFNYSTRTDYHTRYIAGQASYQNYILKSITSISNGSTLCIYNLTHELKDGANLLTSIGCTNSSGEELRPLTFTYGNNNYYGGTETKDIRKDDYLFLSTYFSTSGDVEFIYNRGKYLPNSYKDGVMILPAFSTYDIVATKKSGALWWKEYHYQYGSKYAADQVVLVAPKLTYISDVNNSITVGEGFQCINAVDVDGDGVDEIVKVNFYDTSASAGTTTLKITIYGYNASTGVIAQKKTFNVTVNGIVNDGDLISPVCRSYYFGDFNGDGKPQLLTISYNTDHLGTSRTSYTSLINLDSGYEISETNLLSLGLEDNLFCVDIDGDGKTEICHATSSGLNVYNRNGSTFSLTKTITGITSSTLSAAEYHFTDINGDGYLDIACEPVGTSLYWYVYQYNGESFVSKMINLQGKDEGDKYMFFDINEDGLADLIQRNGTTAYIYLNEKGSYVYANRITSSQPFTESTQFVPCNMMGYNAMSDFITIEDYYVNIYKFSQDLSSDRLITKFTNSLGAITINNYANMAGSDYVYQVDASRTYSKSNGYAKCRFPLQLLYNTQSYLSSSQTEASMLTNLYYTYFDACVHTKGLGFCGFGKVRTTNFRNTTNKELVTIETRNPECMGITTRLVNGHRMTQDDPYDITEYTYDSHSTTYGKLNPRVTKVVHTDTLTTLKSTTTYTYDAYDYPISITVQHSGGQGGNLEESQSVEFLHKSTSSNYCLGTVLSDTRIKTIPTRYVISGPIIVPDRDIIVYDRVSPIDPDDPIKPLEPIDTNLIINPTLPSREVIPASHWVNKQVYTYNDKQLPLSRIEYVGSSSDELSKQSETRWTYDTYGNVLTEMAASYNATEFIGKTYSYDSNGINLQSITNELGQITTFANYNKFGKPLIITDYKGRVTTDEYNYWGKLISRTMPDGTVSSTTEAWGGIGCYTVTSSSSGKPKQIVHYDAAGREVRSGSQRYNGLWLFTDKVYGRNGQIQKVSLPFKSTLEASLWNTYTYDEYLRPVSYTQASGNITTWAYDDESTTESKNGVWSIKTVDSKGQVVKVQDGGGTIDYTLRADGKPSEVAVSGGLSTTFEYDSYGRRVKIVDPSAGTQTDNIVFNSDGSSVSTHTNPNGTIITYSDKYGRTTKVERPGEYTTDYVYSADGLLASETSSNGTSKSYTYDGYDRVLTMTETVPDGKWLKKTYTYTTGSNVNSIAYESQNGTIATENFAYSNGTNIRISLQDTHIRLINGENEFGQPTSVATGGITRTYLYNAYGMPTRRTMGTVMDYSYSFDPLKGNLMSRTDNLRNQTETFGYDALNRLTAIDDREITYSDNGNITSIDSVGDMTYDNSAKPYQVTSLTLEDNVVPSRVQNITYTCYSRPSIMTEGGRSAAFTYNGDGARVKMNVSDGATSVLSRYYIGNQYELDVTPSGTTERLYLGGDAYSAPAVYIKEGSGTWTFYNIGRDYLGNITHIATADGTLVEENSYDPWGRLRNPETREIYSLGTEPELMLGRGYTGHEHLKWFGLINMNARLYDPVIGRFLSPDPFVQMPDFTQNFNRYSYCLNNPLVYVDENGELWSVITAILRLPDTIIRGVFIPFFVGFSDTRRAGQIASSVWQEYGRTVANAAKIDYGIIYTDKNKSAGGRIWEFFSRFLWQPKQFAVGYFASGLYNLFGGVKSVSFYGGATVSESYASGWGDISLGNYIIGQNGIYADPANPDFQHEYGHYIQSQRSGYAYFPRYGVPSLFSKPPHDYHPVEQDANIRALNYFSKHVSGFNSVDAYGNYNGMWDLGYSPILGLKPTDTTVLDKRLKWSFWDLLAGFVPIVGDFAGGGIRSHYDRKKY